MDLSLFNCLLFALAMAGAAPEASMEKPRLAGLAPVMVVESVEPCVKFWVDRFGFTAANQVPGPDGRLMFASVESGGIELMYQTRASVIADRADAAGELVGHSTALFFTVDDLAAAERAVAGAPLVKARHKTSYGTLEIYVREPGGNIVGFAQRVR
jgi:uncharacterized glyoxalase superfamily protein PhnB